MKSPATPVNVPVSTLIPGPSDVAQALSALSTLIAANAAPGGSNPLLEALAQASGYELVPAAPKKPAKRHNGYTTPSKFKCNGARKASAADPIRTPEETRAIGEYLLTHGNERNRQRNYTLYVCGITLGLRVGDLLNITIRDVCDVKTGELLQHARIVNEKTEKLTTDLITPTAQRAILTLIKEIRDEHSGVLDPDWPLFQSQRGTKAADSVTKLNKSQVYRFLTEAAAACGVSGHISTHTMRKTYGYRANKNLIEAGASAAQAMEIVQNKYGHSDQATTMRYIGLMQDQKDAAALSVDASLGLT